MLFDETSDGAVYLSSLKQTGSPQAAGTAPVRGSSPDDRRATEKRRSTRYQCQGSAQLREINGGPATWSRFTDISLHGCYVEAAATYPIGSMLALNMEVNGFRVEARGEVRVTYPNLGMGIFFTTMADDERERLHELVRSLSRPSVITGSGAQHVSRPSPSGASAPVTNPAAAVQAIANYFEDRQILSRDEFFRILRKSQEPGK
ncbi:MAG: PilZ domain-containing protein [Candidatus Sulfotelmatobacter sp.]|jgi:PilZ domain-containing protein